MYKVIKGFRGSPDGHTVVDYQKGETVEMTDSLAEVAIAEKWVEKPKGIKTPQALTKAALAQLQSEITALETALAGAGDADKPTLQEQLDAKKAELSEVKGELDG